MTWLLLRDGRVLARGSYSEVIEAAEERRLVVIETLGRDTGRPAYVPHYAVRGVWIVPESMWAQGRMAA